MNPNPNFQAKEENAKPGRAKYNRAYEHYNDVLDWGFLEEGVLEDLYEKARRFPFGCKYSQYELGCIFYYYSRLIDFRDAFYWFKKAAKQGHTTAMNRLAEMYTIGYGVPINYTQAEYWKVEKAIWEHFNYTS